MVPVALVSGACAPAETWVMSFKGAGHAVDITDVFDRKVAALQAHASQTGGREDLEGMLRTWGESVAQRMELGEGRIAEAFQIVDTR